MNITTWIKKFLAFVLPVIGTAATKAIADEVVKYAYKDEQPYRRNRSYGVTRTNARSQHPSMPQRTRRPVDPAFGLITEDRFHDVLMVALDITGPNMALVKACIENLMPETGEQDNRVTVDSWWIADDAAGTSDCDSAVFVSKGNQDKARELLREHGLVG